MGKACLVDVTVHSFIKIFEILSEMPLMLVSEHVNAQSVIKAESDLAPSKEDFALVEDIVSP